VDLSFDPGTGVDSLVYSIAVQTDGKVLIGGDFTTFDGAARTNVARLNSNGSRDATFDPNPGAGESFTYVNAVALQSSGKVLLGGSFTSVGGAPRTNLARLNANGSLDGSFTAETDDTITAIAVQTNGAILVGGFFAQAIHTPRIGIARLGVDGVLDATFNPVLGGNPFSTVFALAVQGDGKILVGGWFTSVNGTPTTNLARLNVNGTVDGTLKPVSIAGGQLSSAIYALAVDGQGKVLAGGDFSTVNGAARRNLVRLKSDGTPDAGFSPAAGTDFAVNSIAAQSDAKVLLGGFFTEVNGAARNYIA